MTPADDWNTSCRLPDQINCTNREAPDHDFASPPILVRLPNGRRALVAGQKSGVVHALDPDRKGELIWQERVGKGGINGGVQWGSAADQSTSTSRCRTSRASRCRTARRRCPIRAAAAVCSRLRLDSGQRVWHTPPPRACRGRDRCSPAQSAAVSAIPGVAFSGAIDGHIRAFAATDGTIVWDFDTVKTYETVNGVAGARRIAERRRAGDQRRDAVRQLGIRAERHSRQRFAGVFGEGG